MKGKSEGWGVSWEGQMLIVFVVNAQDSGAKGWGRADVDGFCTELIIGNRPRIGKGQGVGGHGGGRC